MILQFDKKVRPENILVLPHHIEGRTRITALKAGGDFSTEVAVDDDQSVAIAVEQFFIDSRAVIKPFQVGQAGQFDEVFIPCKIFGQHDEIVGGFADAVGLFLKARTGGDIKFASEQGFYAGIFGVVVEVDEPEEVTMIGKAQSGHIKFSGSFAELFNGGPSVEQGVMAMAVQVNKGWAIRLAGRTGNNHCPQCLRASYYHN